MTKSFIMFAAILIGISCNDKSTSSSSSSADSTAAASTAKSTDMASENKAKALALEEAFNNHDASAVVKDAAPDIVDYGDGSIPPAKGTDSVKAFIQDYFTAFPDMKGENFVAVAEGNHVAVFGDWSGTSKGEAMGMKPTGKSFKIKDADLFTFNDQGQITEHRSVQSNMVIMYQIGAMKK